MLNRYCLSKVFRLSLAGLILALSFCVTPGFAAPNFDRTLVPYSSPLFSDFDGDNKLDQAVLFSDGAQKNIRIALGKFVWKSLFFDSGVLDRGRLVARLTGDPAGVQPECVLQTTSSAALHLFAHHSYIVSSEAAAAAAEPAAVCSARFSTLRKRGPPSKLP